MKNLTAYAIFVMQAYLAGCKIWFTYKKYKPSYCDKPTWNWKDCFYYIKLPESWEYVIEDGEIAFREPMLGQFFLSEDFKSIVQNVSGDCTIGKRPIIKRKDRSE